MPHNSLLFRSEYSTGSWPMLICVVIGIVLTVFGVPLAILGVRELEAGRREGIFLIGWALFVGVASAKTMWDWFFPKVWSIQLTDTSLSWRTPSSHYEVSLTNVVLVKIDNRGDIARMWVTTTDGEELYVHPNCFSRANVKQFGRELKMHFPGVPLDFAGVGKKDLLA